MLKSRKNFLMNCVLSIAIFVMLFGSLFFYRVHIDNYIFYTFTDFNFNSIVDYCLHYGNGRFLGNFICAVMSHLFYASPLFTSTSLLAIFLLLNKLIFESNYKTLLIIFILFYSLEFSASERMYGYLPMYVNYVLPFLFFLLSLQLSKNFKKAKGIVKVACGVAMCAFAFSSALFSENTSLVFILCILIYIIYGCLKIKKVSFSDACLFGFTLLGLITMLLLPHFFGVADLLKWYRGSVDLTVKSLVIQSALLSKYIVGFPLLLTVVSAAEFIYLFFVSDKKANICIYLTVFAVPMISAIMLESSMDNILERLIGLFVLVLFAAAILWALFMHTKKEHRPVLWGLGILVASNIGICLFVEPIGIRVLFVSYFFAIVWLLYSVKFAYPRIKECVKASFKSLLLVLFVMSAVFSAFIFLENVDLFVKQIYDLADESVRQTVDLEDSGMNTSKYLFAFRNRELAHPKYMKETLGNNEAFLEHIDSFDH